MCTFSQTRAAAERIRDHARSEIARARAVQLLDQLARCEAALVSSARPPCPSTWGLLRALVLTVRDLAGRWWLEASSDDPAVCAFTALLDSPAPPAITDLDRVAGGVLSARFGPVTPGATRTVSRSGTPGRPRPANAPRDGTPHLRDLRRARLAARQPQPAGQGRPADRARPASGPSAFTPGRRSRAVDDRLGGPG